MKENLAIAIVFAVALYCLMMIGIIANNVIIMKGGESYLDLIETHKQHKKINLFEKVIVMTKRAKSLYSLEAPALARLKHKPTYQAILESNKGRLTMKRVEKENI